MIRLDMQVSGEWEAGHSNKRSRQCKGLYEKQHGILGKLKGAQ